MRTLFRLLLFTLFALSHSLSALAGPRGTLIVSNHRPDDVLVLVDGKALGPVAASTDGVFRLNAGPRDLQIRDTRGAPVQHRRFVLDPGEVETVTLAPPQGQIQVFNDAGTTVRLSLDGQDLGALPSGGVRALTVSAGTHGLAATYEQLGADRLLSQQTVGVPSGGLARVELKPVSSGLVRVENQTGRDAQILTDGLDQGRVRNGAAVEVKTRLGRVDLALVEDGRTLAHSSLAVGRYEDKVWRATAPRTGDLVVTNPLPMAVVARSSAGRSTTLAPQSKTTLTDLPVGTATLAIARTTGEPIATASVSIRPYDAARYTVPTPHSGLVSVRTSEGTPLTVLVDGRSVAPLSPYSETRLDLGLGWHRLQLRDPRGRIVWDTRVLVDPVYTQSVEFGRGSVSSHSDHRDHHGHERPDHAHY